MGNSISPQAGRMTMNRPYAQPRLRHSSAATRLEIFSPLLIVVVHYFLYNALGTTVEDQGLDFSWAIRTPLDDRIPFVPLLIIPYLLAWIYPLLLIIYLIRKRGCDVVMFRRIVFSSVVLLAICYLLWGFYPVKVWDRVADAELLAGGWLEQLTLFTYQYTTVWNACPSFHIAGPWFLYRAAEHYGGSPSRTLLALFVATAISAVAVRIHYLVDRLVGLLIAELVVRQVLLRFETRKSFATLPTMQVLVAYSVVVLLGATIYVRIA
jgi:hypothetical protein